MLTAMDRVQDISLARLPLARKTFGKLRFITYRPEPHAERQECHRNVLLMVERNGGRRVTGWLLLENTFAIYACFHSVWKEPSGALIDITPKRQDWRTGDETCFVKAPRCDCGCRDEMVRWALYDMLKARRYNRALGMKGTHGGHPCERKSR